MTKKAIFFTIAAIALTAVIVVTYSAYTSFRLSDKMEVVKTRIETMNFFIKDVEDDLKKGIFISGTRVLLSFNQYIISNGSYLDNINARFKEAFLNGTINEQSLSLMKDSTFTDWANKIAEQANKIDVKFNFTINDVKLNQSDPWSVDAHINISLDIRDKRNTSYWIRDRFLTTKIDITDFEDPLYIVNSNGRLTNTIVRSNITNFVVNKDVTNLIIHMNNSRYIQHNDSPSYLMRFEGNLGNSSFGIESLVNLEEFLQEGFTLKDRSIVDYIYFGAQTTTNYRINKTPEWFKIDSGHLYTYQVNESTCTPSECITP